MKGRKYSYRNLSPAARATADEWIYAQLRDSTDEYGEALIQEFFRREGLDIVYYAADTHDPANVKIYVCGVFTELPLEAQYCCRDLNRFTVRGYIMAGNKAALMTLVRTPLQKQIVDTTTVALQAAIDKLISNAQDRLAHIIGPVYRRAGIRYKAMLEEFIEENMFMFTADGVCVG